jgi:hypothetical protein
MKYRGIQALEEMIGKLDDVEVIQISWELLARIVLEILWVNFRTKKILVKEGTLLHNPEAHHSNCDVNKKSEGTLGHHLGFHSTSF